jgi:hypothetical protein
MRAKVRSREELGEASEPCPTARLRSPRRVSRILDRRFLYCPFVDGD